jgi:acyl carrier protein
MTRSDFLRCLEEALEITPHTLDESQVLAELETYDSMSALIFMAVADEQLKFVVGADQLAKCVTVKDLVDLVGSKLSG